MAVRNKIDDLRTLVPALNPVIVDAGANIGNTVEEFLGAFASPTVHAFEPNPAIFEKLKSRFEGHPRVTPWRKALGAESGVLAFNVLNAHRSSSLLKPTTEAQGRYGGKFDTAETVNVDVVRLDAVIDGPVDIVKMDLQGYELYALQGSEKLLPRVRVVVTEVEFIRLYEQQPLFTDVDAFLRSHGFRLFNLYELFTDSRGQLICGDAIFLNTELV